MHKNRVIIVLGILIILLSDSGFPPSTKSYLIQASAVLVVILAFLIEKKGVFTLNWHKKEPVTPVASTYVEHNGSAAPTSKSTVTATNTQQPS